MIKKVHYEHNFVHLFLNNKSTGMNITNCFVAVFKYEILIDIQCSLKTASYPVLINEIPGTVFCTNLLTLALIVFKNCIF
jgi:hypothetical protein